MATETKPEQEYVYQVDQQVSVNAFIDVDVRGENVRFQITNRYGASPEKVIKTAMASIEAYIALRDLFPRTLVTPTLPPEKKLDGTQPQSVMGNTRPVVDTSTNTLEVVKVEVTPKPDGKAELKLYAAGHKYPDLYHNGKTQQLVAALSTSGYEWTEEQFRTAGSFDVTFYADWRNSERMNNKGNPYKDVIGYRAIDAAA
jgi:hypothetical protein